MPETDLGGQDCGSVHRDSAGRGDGERREIDLVVVTESETTTMK